MFIGIRNLCWISKDVGLLHRKVFLIYKTMSDYRGILDYRDVRLERFQCTIINPVTGAHMCHMHLWPLVNFFFKVTVPAAGCQLFTEVSLLSAIHLCNLLLLTKLFS